MPIISDLSDISNKIFAISDKFTDFSDKSADVSDFTNPITIQNNLEVTIQIFTKFCEDMSNKNVGLSSKYEEVVGSSTIYITNKTVQFGEEVYQFHNMTGFGVSEIPRILVPIKLILGLFLLGLFAANFPDDAARSFGIFLIVISLVCLIYNQVQPRKYGLAIYFNSGRSRFFSTRDKEGLKAVVATLYKYMDSDKDLGTYVVNIVEGNVTGNFIGGNAHENNVNFR